MMKYFTLLTVLLSMSILSFGNVKDLDLSDEVLADLLKSCQAIEAIEDVTPEQVDSVTELHDNLRYIPEDDLALLYSFLVPQLIEPDISDNRKSFDLCEAFGRKYTSMIAATIPQIISKYERGNEELLTENFGSYFHLYLYTGLATNGKLSELTKYDLESITNEALEQLFIAARGGAADDVIYFIMAHSTVSFFDPMTKKYKIASYKL